MSSKLIPSIQYTIGASDIGKKKFDFSFPVLQSKDIKVILGDGTIPVGYSVDLLTKGVGGYITFTSGFAVGTNITIYRDMSFSRQTKFRENQDFHASVINEEFDRIVMLLQQAGRMSNSSLRQKVYDTKVDMELPSINDRAGKLLAFDKLGKPEVIQSEFTSVKKAEEYSLSAKSSSDIINRNIKIIDEKLKKFNSDNYLKKDISNLDINNLLGKLNLGTAATLNTGLNPGDVPIVDDTGKLSSNLFDSSGFSSNVHIMLYIDRTIKFFIPNVVGDLPNFVNDPSVVWFLSEQKKSLGGSIPQGKTHIELPEGLCRFHLYGAGGGGNNPYCPMSAGRGGDTYVIGVGEAYGGRGAVGNVNGANLNSRNFANTINYGLGTIINIIGGGSSGGDGSFNAAISQYGSSGMPGSRLISTAKLRKGLSFNAGVGAGGRGVGVDTRHTNILDTLKGKDGLDGFIIVEYT